MSNPHVSADSNGRDDPPVPFGTLLAIGAVYRSGARERLTNAIGDLDDLTIPVPAGPDSIIQNMVGTADLSTSLNVPTVVALGLDCTDYESK